MSNYTSENLINVPASSSLQGTLAMKVGDDVFTAGHVTINSANQFYKCASYTPATPGGEDQNKIIVSGSAQDAEGNSINGTYTLVDPTATGFSRVWECTISGRTYTISCPYDQPPWDLKDDADVLAFIDTNDPIGSGWGVAYGDSMTTAYGTTTPTPASWTGYKAVLSQGVYSFESTLTTDSLTCTSVTPVVNGIYTADALCTVGSLYVGLPADGLILYLPLSSAQSTAATGQDLTTVGSPSFATESGIASCYFNGSSYIQFPVSVNMSSPFTISWWLKRTYDRDRDIFGFSSNEFSSINGYVYSMSSNAVRAWIGAAMNWNVNNNWNNLIETYDGSTLKTYVNGTLQYSTAHTISSLSATSGRVGATSSSSYKFVGYMAGFRLYNRCITQSEITALAGEFTPTDA